MLTELDNCILAVIWRGAPMSAYGVRSHFAASATATWSSSTGTIYPAIRRLRAAGLVQAKAPTGPRRTELLSLTAAGRRAVNQWLTKLPPGLGTATADPIRTRVHFLAAVPSAARKEALDAYRRATSVALARLETALTRPLETPVDRSEQLGRLGAIAELQARLDFLDLAERELSAD